MSETTHYRGILREVKPIDGKTLQETAKQLFDDLGHTVNDYNKKYYPNDYVKHLCNADFNYITFNYKLYKITKEELDPYDDIIRASLNEDGSIDFEVKYYDGGGSMHEAIDSALKKLDL